MAAIRELDRRTPDRLVSGEVLARDDAAAPLHGADDQVRSLALVESVSTTLGDAPQHGCLLRRAPRIADGNELSVAQEQSGTRRVLREAIGAILIIIRERGVDDEASLGEIHGWAHQLTPWLRPVLPVGLEETGHRPRNTGRQRT